MGEVSMDELDKRTLAEQAAGRGALERFWREQKVEDGALELRSRLPRKNIEMKALLVMVTPMEYQVRVTIRLDDGLKMEFSDSLSNFPSDFLVTQMLLVV